MVDQQNENVVPNGQNNNRVHNYEGYYILIILLFQLIKITIKKVF